MGKCEFGRWGERLVCKLLVQRGHRILDENYTCRQGEIDIVAEKEETLIFVEVKTRRGFCPASPLESVTYRKRKRLIRAARYYLYCFGPELKFSACRFDVAGVIYHSQEQRAEIQLIKNAFDIRGGRL